MIKTRITELLGIKYPILMGAMHQISFAEMVSAVGEAGGIGFIPAASFDGPEALRDEIRKAKDLTDGPIGLNISLVPGIDPGEGVVDLLEVGLKEGVSAIETAGRPPEAIIGRIKEANIPLIHKSPQIRFAKKAQELGADAVIILGFEGGGYIGMAEVTTLVMVNKAARELEVPVIAGGGISDGRGLVCALALGADGVLMGTRFLASKEATIHQNFKDWMVNATENDTSVIMRSIKTPVRAIKNESAREVEEIEKKGGGLEEILAMLGPRMGRVAYDRGDVENDLLSVGEGIGLIDEIESIKEIIDGMVAEAEEVILRLNSLSNS